MLFWVFVMELLIIAFVVASTIILVVKYNNALTRITTETDRLKAEFKAGRITDAITGRKPSVIRLDDKHEDRARIKTGGDISDPQMGEGW